MSCPNSLFSVGNIYNTEIDKGYKSVLFFFPREACLENPMDGGACRLQSMGSLRVRHN